MELEEGRGGRGLACVPSSSAVTDVTYMDLAIRYVNETAANNDKVEHVPRVAEVVLRDRRRGIEREKRRETVRE